MRIIRLIVAAGCLGGAVSAQVPLFGLGRTVFPQPVRYDALHFGSGQFYTEGLLTNIHGMVNTHPITLDIVSNLVYLQVTELSDGGNTQQVYAIQGGNGVLRHRMSLPNNLLTLFNLYTVNGALYGFGAQQLTQKIFRINPGASSLVTLGAHTNFAGIQSVAFDPVSNRVYITTLTPDFSSARLAVLNATNGAFQALITRSNDYAETFAHAGSLYALSPLGGTSRLLRINLGTGAETLITAFPTNFGTVGTTVMDYDEGRVYVGGTEGTNNVIRRINVTNGVVEAVCRPQLGYLALVVNPWITLPDLNLPAATVGWRTVSGFPYRVQSAPAAGGAWVDVGALVTGQGGRTQVLASATATTSVFRVVTKP